MATIRMDVVRMTREIDGLIAKVGDQSPAEANRLREAVKGARTPENLSAVYSDASGTLTGLLGPREVNFRGSGIHGSPIAVVKSRWLAMARSPQECDERVKHYNEVTKDLSKLGVS